MKKENDNILDKCSRKDGLTVPTGYFDDFAKRMAENLPARPELEMAMPEKRTFWQTVRPYVYMAAMFMGVWCMLSLFTKLSSASDKLSIEANPELATAVSNERFVEDYIIDDINEYDIYDSMLADSIDMQDIGDSLDSMYVSEEADSDGEDDTPAPILPQ